MMHRPPREPGLLRRASLWLLLLGPLFFATYGFATWATGQRSDVGTLVFEWERAMPFWAWSIVPYWSIDLLYGLSLLLPVNRGELTRHALRLLSAQLIAVSCFLLWPLRFTFDRPAVDGVFGWMFAVLGEFDKPFNQAPSLHIALLVVLWVMYRRHSQGAARWLVHGWFALIGISVLTTYQHHFIDVPTGALAGWFCVWLWPLKGPALLSRVQLRKDLQRFKLALLYIICAACLMLASSHGGVWLWLIWPMTAALLVGLNYAVLGTGGFQKGATGRMSGAGQWLFAPYLVATWVNSRLWTRSQPEADEIADDVWLGRFPTSAQACRYNAVVDLCAELPFYSVSRSYVSIPILDLTVPTPEQCIAAAAAIERLHQQGPLLVCCALGYSRSAMAVAAWLLYSGRADSVATAVAMIKTKRPQVILRPAHRQVLEVVYGP